MCTAGSQKAWALYGTPAVLCTATLPGCAEFSGVETEEKLGNERRRDGEEGEKKKSPCHNDLVWELPAFLTSRP